ncbi:ATPase synthesis protein 25 mitochondrial [Ceratocystis platani]|uniref:ATPase synthesis protein 25 n=1 Tax=Ceratocystis fimbriata f. sp. platani TaxID=88771 RepID=A0A0F8DL47_CERFI|nr:ATPase synthesis protein 25 mitochondrial [Ceratocystis platani]
MLSRSAASALRASRAHTGTRLATTASSTVSVSRLSLLPLPLRPLLSSLHNIPHIRAYSDSTISRPEAVDGVQIASKTAGEATSTSSSAPNETAAAAETDTHVVADPSTEAAIGDELSVESTAENETGSIRDSSPPLANPTNPPQETEAEIEHELITEDQDLQKPHNYDMAWYLEVDPPIQPPSDIDAPLPSLPENSPSLLDPLVKYAYEDMGLDGMNIMDLRELDPPPALGPNLIMVFGTARSERHLHVSSARLVRWLRYNYHVEASADGLIGAGELRTKLRRLRRKDKIMGSGNVVHHGGDDGISTGWICVNLGTIGNTISEELHIDGAGKMSGFGGSTDGTTIVLQVMTESRREELALEQLWSRSLAGNFKMRTKLMEPLEGDRGSKPVMPNNWDKKLRRKRKRQQQKGFVEEGDPSQ